MMWRPYFAWRRFLCRLLKHRKAYTLQLVRSEGEKAICEIKAICLRCGGSI